MMNDIWEEIIRLKRAAKDSILVTVIDKKGQGPSVVGHKMLVDRQGIVLGSIGGGELEYRAIEKAQELMSNKSHALESYNLSANQSGPGKSLNMICGGMITLFFEYLPIRPVLYIMGAGHVGTCLAALMNKLDWQITLLDCRPEITRELADDCRILIGNGAEAIQNEAAPRGCFVLIAGFSHEADYQILKAIYLAEWQPGYIGLLASLKKARMMIEKLQEELGPDIDLSIIRSPVGLDIGGDTPAEIALSITAEIQAVRYGKCKNRHLGKTWGKNLEDDPRLLKD